MPRRGAAHGWASRSCPCPTTTTSPSSIVSSTPLTPCFKRSSGGYWAASASATSPLGGAPDVRRCDGGGCRGEHAGAEGARMAAVEVAETEDAAQHGERARRQDHSNRQEDPPC